MVVTDKFTGEPATKVAMADAQAIDPKQEETFIGPMIDVREAQRLETWIADAISAGGKLLCGGNRQGALLDATLLEAVPKN